MRTGSQTLSSTAPRAFEASPAYSRTVLALFFGVGVFALADRYIFGMLIEPIKREFALSDTWLGLLAGRLARQRGDRAPNRQREQQNGSVHNLQFHFTIIFGRYACVREKFRPSITLT